MMTDTELLWEAVVRNGGSVPDFAWDTLIRHPSTVRRWLHAESPIPLPVRRWLHKRRTWLESTPQNGRRPP